MRGGLAVAALGMLSATSWLVCEVIRRVIPPPQFDQDGRLHQLLKLDPPRGKPLRVPGLPTKGEYVVIWLGDCTQCTKNTLDEKRLKAVQPDGSKIVLLTSQRSSEFDITKDYRTIVLTDLQKKSINAFFAPRAYILKDGNLARLQQLGEATLQVVAG